MTSTINKPSSDWDVEYPKTVKYEDMTSLGPMLFNATITVNGNNQELSYTKELLNGYTEQPVAQILIRERKALCDPCVLHFAPLAPWCPDGKLDIRMLGSIEGCPRTPYFLVVYIHASRGTSKKLQIKLVPEETSKPD